MLKQCRLVQSHQFVAGVHQNAPNRVLHFQNFPRTSSQTPQWGAAPDAQGSKEAGLEGKRGGTGREVKREGKG